MRECLPPAHATQSECALAPAGELWPALQSSRQVLCPAWISYLPGLHDMYVLAPVEAEYLPAAQDVHVLALLAPVEYLPAAQDVQTWDLKK